MPFCGPGPPLRQVLSLLVLEDPSGYMADHMVGLSTLFLSTFPLGHDPLSFAWKLCCVACLPCSHLPLRPPRRHFLIKMSRNPLPMELYNPTIASSHVPAQWRENPEPPNRPTCGPPHIHIRITLLSPHHWRACPPSCSHLPVLALQIPNILANWEWCSPAVWIFQPGQFPRAFQRPRNGILNFLTSIEMLASVTH